MLKVLLKKTNLLSMPGVYFVRNKISGKKYVGSSKNMGARWRVHVYELKRGKHHSPHLQASWNKYGPEAFEHKVLIVCEPTECVRYEQYFLDTLQPEYNTSRFAYSCLGVKHSAETREKLSQIRKGQKRSLEARRNMALAKIGNQYGKGKHRSPEMIEKWRESVKWRFKAVENDKGEKFESINAAAKATGSCHQNLARSIAKNQRCCGKKWKYIETGA